MSDTRPGPPWWIRDVISNADRGWIIVEKESIWLIDWSISPPDLHPWAVVVGYGDDSLKHVLFVTVRKHDGSTIVLPVTAPAVQEAMPKILETAWPYKGG